MCNYEEHGGYIMDTLSTLSLVQLARAETFFERVLDNPFRAMALSMVQHRNAALDALFYDVGAVTEEEILTLAKRLAREGAVLLVPPTGQGSTQVFLDAEAFLATGARIGALVVAGVGSSALGATALARNVADAVGTDVAAVVSGYGLADVLTEAVGGYFWFGGLNSLRHLFEPLDAVTKRFTATERELEEERGLFFVRTSKDTASLVRLLNAEELAIPYLIGHSKGNLVISEALYALDANHPERAQQLAAQTRIVTISAKVGMPQRFHRVLDIIGVWDTFGQLNSRPDIPADVVVPRAWHSTNPDFPLDMGIRVTEVLRDALPRFDALTQSAQTALGLFQGRRAA
jgi:hypothetical protein